MKPAEYLEHAIVGDRVRVTNRYVSVAGFVDVKPRGHGVQLVIVPESDSRPLVIREADGSVPSWVVNIERLPLGVPA